MSAITKWKAHLQRCCEHRLTKRKTLLGPLNIRCLPAKLLCLAERDGLSLETDPELSGTLDPSLTSQSISHDV